MKRLNEQLLSTEAFSELMMGNHALVRGMIEAGVKVTTTYPGSPTPEIADAIQSIRVEERPFRFEYSVNEKVALEVAFGASMNGHLSTVFFKSVGLNVASDSAVQLALMELLGGMVIILGDDPGMNSSQNEQDNRHFARMSYIPMFEPATPGETYRMFLQAAELSQTRRMPVFLRLTTHVCHAREVVDFASWSPDSDYDWTPRFSPENGGPFIPITRLVDPMKARALAKLNAVAEEAETHAANQVLSPNSSELIDGKRLGLITASLPALSLLENLSESKHPIDLFRLGLSYPLPKRHLVEFMQNHDEVLVVEELDRVMEQELKALAFDAGISVKLHAKPDRYLPGELGPRATWDILAGVWPKLFTPRESGPSPVQNLPPRAPTFCSGCGHRAAFFAVKKALGDSDITVADIGCHTMGAFEPYNVGQVLLCMGHSTGTAAGLSIGNDTRKVVAFLGDSTFYHAGMPGIVNAVLYDHDITLIVMENGTTAMTGQQPNPGSGEVGEKIPIQNVLEGMGAKVIDTVDCYNHDKLLTAIKTSMDHKGFSVVVASHPCMLKWGRQLSKKGLQPPMLMTVESEKIPQGENEAIVGFGCPSFERQDDDTVGVNASLCIGCGSCRPSSPSGGLVMKKRQEVLK